MRAAQDQGDFWEDGRDNAICPMISINSDRRFIGDRPWVPVIDGVRRNSPARRRGWLIDRWLGISPRGMIVFLLLGFAAGVLNVMRAAGVIRK
jgi:hypothetical protein